MDIALSDTQVLTLVGGKANIIMYPDIHKYRSIDELLAPHGACFILFESKPYYGHWCALIKLDDNNIEFFDPYGSYPDDSLDYIPEKFAKESFQDHPYLSYLMMKSPYQLSYNEHAFQKKGPNIKTCGRWSATRIALKDLSLEQFTKMFLRGSDKLVTRITSWINEI